MNEYILGRYLLTSSVVWVLSVIFIDHLVDELINFISIEVSTGDLSNLLIDLVSSIWDELGKSKGRIDLSAPFSKVLDVTSIEFVWDELFEEAGGTIHVVVFVGVLESNVKGCSHVVMSGLLSLILSNLDGAISEVIWDVDVWDVDIR